MEQAGGERNVRVCYQPRVWTRKKRRGNLQMKENHSGPIPHPSPPPQKRQGEGIIHIKDRAMQNPDWSWHLWGSMIPTLRPSLSFLCYLCTQCTFFFHWPHCVMAKVISPRLLPPRTLCAPWKLNHTLVPQCFCLAHDKYTKTVTGMNLDKHLFPNENQL